jgi:exosortase/archaeosortase family protein
MNYLSIASCVVVLVGGLYAWLQVFSEMLMSGYGELPVLTPVLLVWAMIMGHRYGTPGPIQIPRIREWSLSLLGILCFAFSCDHAWISTYLIAPACLFLCIRFAPHLATARILLLFFIAPTSYYIDQHFGESLQLASATGAAWLSQLIDSDLGLRTDNVLWCEPHRIIVTSACSGARLAIRMTAIAVFVSALKRTNTKIIASLIAIALALSVVTNTVRISVLCLAAPSYDALNLAGLEQYHDRSGVIVFLFAYLILAWLNSKLSGRLLSNS